MATFILAAYNPTLTWNWEFGPILGTFGADQFLEATVSGFADSPPTTDFQASVEFHAATAGGTGLRVGINGTGWQINDSAWTGTHTYTAGETGVFRAELTGTVASIFWNGVLLVSQNVGSLSGDLGIRLATWQADTSGPITYAAISGGDLVAAVVDPDPGPSGSTASALTAVRVPFLRAGMPVLRDPLAWGDTANVAPNNPATASATVTSAGAALGVTGTTTTGAGTIAATGAATGTAGLAGVASGATVPAGAALALVAASSGGSASITASALAVAAVAGGGVSSGGSATATAGAVALAQVGASSGGSAVATAGAVALALVGALSIASATLTAGAVASGVAVVAGPGGLATVVAGGTATAAVTASAAVLGSVTAAATGVGVVARGAAVLGVVHAGSSATAALVGAVAYGLAQADIAPGDVAAPGSDPAALAVASQSLTARATAGVELAAQATPRGDA